ncbi:MAG: GNAT family N-acetyltransferase, partial [Gemmatimonadota bacterium]
YWTFDPLVARNAHLNLNRLGAEIAEYVPDMYGADTGSELHSGMGTDRFVVTWHLRSRRVEAALADRPPDDAPFPDAALVTDDARPDADPVRVEIPADIQAMKAESRERARRWRVTTRRALLHYLGRGYRVVTLLRDEDGRVFYGLTRDA